MGGWEAFVLFSHIFAIPGSLPHTGCREAPAICGSRPAFTPYPCARSAIRARLTGLGQPQPLSYCIACSTRVRRLERNGRTCDPLVALRCSPTDSPWPFLRAARHSPENAHFLMACLAVVWHPSWTTGRSGPLTSLCGMVQTTSSHSALLGSASSWNHSFLRIRYGACSPPWGALLGLQWPTSSLVAIVCAWIECQVEEEQTCEHWGDVREPIEHRLPVGGVRRHTGHPALSIWSFTLPMNNDCVIFRIPATAVYCTWSLEAVVGRGVFRMLPNASAACCCRSLWSSWSRSAWTLWVATSAVPAGAVPVAPVLWSRCLPGRRGFSLKTGRQSGAQAPFLANGWTAVGSSGHQEQTRIGEFGNMVPSICPRNWLG